MATNSYSINNSIDFFLNEYLKEYRVKLINHADFSSKTTFSKGSNYGALKSINSFHQSVQNNISTNGVEPTYRQRINFLANDDMVIDREDWESFINLLIQNQNISFHQSGFNLPNNEVLTVSNDNELFAESHAFYQFRLRNYENYQASQDEINLPSFINAVYYNNFSGYQKAIDLYTFNNTMDISSRFITEIPGVNSSYKLFNNHLFKHKSSQGGSSTSDSEDAIFVVEGNYFYDYASLNNIFNDVDNERHKNIFMMFKYNPNLNNKVLEVPYFNYIKLNYTNTFQMNNRVKESFEEMKLPEILMSMLKNNITSPKSFAINGTQTSVQTIDFIDNFMANNSFTSVEREDETFLYDPNVSIFDDNNNAVEYLFRKLVLLGKVRDLMIEQLRSFSDIFPQDSQEPQYKEFIAYKIEKQRPINNIFRTVQTFYVYSHDKVRSFIDSQIRLDQLYRYNVTAFFLICGHEVSFEDIRTCDKNESNFWYNGSSETSEVANIMSNNRFGAKATLVVKPSWKIVEIPVFSKLMRVVEPPPIEPRVSFRDVGGKNNKIKIHFEDPFEVNIFDNDRKPMVSFNEVEQDYYSKLIRYTYMGNIYSTFAASDSVFDVYRLETKPKSMMDFSDALYHTAQSSEIDEFGDRDVMSTMFDYLEHQKKYYYIVRTRTHRNNLSNPSPIYVVEKFKDADETILKVETMTIDEEIAPSMETKFRRFMQVNIDDRHLFVKSETYQNGQSAFDNITNILLGQDNADYESIWSYAGDNTNNENKYIKLRLESKRTGKKIDLNFYFKIQTPQGNT